MSHELLAYEEIVLCWIPSHIGIQGNKMVDQRVNRIPGWRFLISSLPGSALRTHAESIGKPRDVNKRSQSLAW